MKGTITMMIAALALIALPMVGCDQEEGVYDYEPTEEGVYDEGLETEQDFDLDEDAEELGSEIEEDTEEMSEEIGEGIEDAGEELD